MSGSITENTEQLWFVCHGYGQLANHFLKNFEALDQEQNCIIAPEGLHRFYWKGFSDKVVASWMTKEDRESDITDYVNFLDRVYDEVISFAGKRELKINVLGFSQGAATVCRWVANNHVKVHKLILWAGAFPSDLVLNTETAVFNTISTYLVVGDADEFINEEEVQKHQQLLQDHQLPFKLMRFHGKHEINRETLLELQKCL